MDEIFFEHPRIYSLKCRSHIKKYMQVHVFKVRIFQGKSILEFYLVRHIPVYPELAGPYFVQSFS